MVRYAEMQTVIINWKESQIEKIINYPLNNYPLARYPLLKNHHSHHQQQYHLPHQLPLHRHLHLLH